MSNRRQLSPKSNSEATFAQLVHAEERMSPIRSRFLISGPRDPARMCDLSNIIGLLISSHLGFRPVGVEKEAYRLIYTNALEVINPPDSYTDLPVTPLNQDCAHNGGAISIWPGRADNDLHTCTASRVLCGALRRSVSRRCHPCFLP